MTSRRKPPETFLLALTSVKTSLENLSSYTSSLALKFLHKEICLNYASSECSYDSKDSEICFIRDYVVEVEDGFEAANDTDSNESLEEMANADKPLADEE